jgi:hypothetical protein
MLRIRSLLVVALAFAASCSDATAPTRSDVVTNREKWAANGYPSYTMTMSRVCFCGEVGPYRVLVVNDSIISATRDADGTAADPRYLPTINELFDFIDTAIAEKAARIDVQYDAALGFPQQVDYDRSLNIADEELFYTVSNVKPLSVLRQGTAPAAPARRGSAPAVTLPLSMRTAAP